MNTLNSLCIKLSSYNKFLLESATDAFIKSVKDIGCSVCGPIPLPRKIEKFTVTRSPHVDKKSMETFVKTTYTRLVQLSNISSSLISKLSEIEIPSGVGIEVKVKN